jgi:hypothetical protein
MVEAKTLSPISHHRAIEPCVAPHAIATVTAHRAHGAHALAAHWPRLMHRGLAKGRWLGQLAGPWPSRPLWLWAHVQPTGIVNFSIFL